MSNRKIISAGAGSGKTYRLTEEMVNLLKDGVRADGIIATTFTTKAAAELQERVRIKLLEEGMTDKANELTNALIGTVHGLGVKLLRRFAFEAGVSPQVDIIADEDQQILFNKALATVLTNQRMQTMDRLSNLLGLNKKEQYDWRREVKYLTDAARANDFSIEVLEKSKVQSFETFKVFLGQVSDQSSDTFNSRLQNLLTHAIQAVHNNEDSTKTTQTALNILQNFLNKLQNQGKLEWHEWVKISKSKFGAKSKADVAELVEFARTHDTHPEFQKTIQSFINIIFEISIEAIKEYETYKKQRGLIDYIDMELEVKRLLDNERVKNILKDELDLLMVDEFQDTSPIQLEIFHKLSQIATYSVWVGDPKQSIYGFRGADPELMQAIIKENGGVKKEDIQKHSWRSREDIVFATNALFVKAFPDMEADKIVLLPKRCKIASADSVNKENEPIEMEDALQHWYFTFDGEGKRLPGRPWMENCISEGIQNILQRGMVVQPKEEKNARPVRPGDIAVLCRSNAECIIVAEAIHRTGLKAAISRNGLLNTAEAKLILACLKFVLYKSDSLSIAEILLLASEENIEDIIDNRIEYLEQRSESNRHKGWADKDKFIKQLNKLREEVVELSGSEILNLVIEELDLRRIIASWGRQEQRMDNIDVLRKLALQYEEACNRLHTAASLGGFLLWLNEMELNEKDAQGSGEGSDAVNVMTYHKSKGLEWPVVICHSLEGKLRENIWGMNIIPEKETIDLDNILGNRWLRYWINPYGDQYRNTALEDRINNSEIKTKATARALQEEARLLYVGITRARDYLIFPERPQPTKWLNRVWHQGNADYPTLDYNTVETPWEWKGNFLTKFTEVLPFPRLFPHTDIVESNLQFLASRSGSAIHTPFLIDSQKETFAGDYKAKVGANIEYGSALPLKEEENLYSITKLTKAFINSDHLDYPAADRLATAAAMIERFELTEQIAAKDLMQYSDSFLSYLKQTYSYTKMYRAYPLTYIYKKRKFETVVDLILETANGYIVIQHNDFSGTKKDRKNKALLQTDWVFLTNMAIPQILGEKPIQTFIHFVIGGQLIGINTQLTPATKNAGLTLF